MERNVIIVKALLKLVVTNVKFVEKTNNKNFGADVQVFSESDSEIYDPEGKARHARPFKPAILIE